MRNSEQGQPVAPEWMLAELIERSVHEWQVGRAWHVGLEVLQTLRDAGFKIVTKEQV